MPLDISKYGVIYKKKRSFLTILKIKWFKFKKRVKRDMKKPEHTANTEFLDLLIWIWEKRKNITIFCIIVLLFLLQPTQQILKNFYNTTCLPFLKNSILWIILIVAAFYLFGIIVKAVEIEKKYENKLENKNAKYNIKKGFNRINVIFCVLCTVVCFCCLLDWQYNEYTNFEKTNVKFYDIQTKKIIQMDICDYFPSKKHYIDYSRSYYLDIVTPNMCTCKSFDNDMFLLEHKKDVYIRMPKYIEKIFQLLKCLFWVFLYTTLFYIIMRGIYILVIYIIDWFIKGFRNN